jgi:toxin ParE1/3/4
MTRELRSTEEAATDLEYITGYLFQNAAELAADLVRGIYNAPSALLTFPYRGRAGRKEGTREIVLSPLRYIVVYQITRDVIHIGRIQYDAQKWP